jgi:hypothetical protein
MLRPLMTLLGAPPPRRAFQYGHWNLAVIESYSYDSRELLA